MFGLPFLSAVVAASGVYAAYDRAHDCNLLFAKDGTISRAEYDPTFQHCTIDTDAPTTVGTVNTHIYHFNEARGWVDDEVHEILLTAVREAMNEAITVYSTFATMPEVYIFVVREDWNKLDQADTWIAVPGEPCRVRVFYENMRRGTMATNKQTIAHELFHCVQWQQFGPDAFDLKNGIASHDWWIEGGADFFSAIVYPNVNDEWNWSRYYDPSQSLYKHSYAASVFFEWIYNNPDAGISAAGIWEWMKTFTLTHDWVTEAGRVAGLSEMSTWFPSFIEAHEGKGVPDTDGVSLVPRFHPMPTHRFTTSLSKSKPSSDHTIKVVSFTGDLSATQLKEGQIVTLAYTSQSDKLKVKYKLDLGNAYEDLWQELKAGTDVTLTLPCGQGGTLQLLTSSIAADDQSLNVKITRTEKTKCSCKSKDGPPFADDTSVVARKRYIKGDPRWGKSHSLAAVDVADIDPTDPTGGEPVGGSAGGDSGAAEGEEDEDEEENECDDKCVVGSWSLNLLAMEDLMRKALVIPDVPEVTITNIHVTGSSVMSIADTWVGNWTYDTLSVAFDVNTLDFGPQHTKVVVDGDMTFSVGGLSNATAEGEGTVVTKRQEEGGEDGEFTMQWISSTGTVVSYSPLIGEINWPMDSSYVPPDLVLKYVCTNTTLALTGFVGGAAQGGWVYAFDRI